MFVRTLSTLVILQFALCGGAHGADENQGALNTNESVPASENKVQLSTEEIIFYFSDVRDDAQIQDSAKTTAVNYWYADGRFVNQWKNQLDSGAVTGSWRAQDDMRCVLILSGLEDRNGTERCSPVYKSGDEFISLNRDGSIHAIHTLSDINLESSDRDQLK